MAEIENLREGMLLQWQYMSEEGEAWQDISDSLENTYACVLDEGNEGWLWRMLITVPEDA